MNKAGYHIGVWVRTPDVVGAKDHQKFQASYATILKAHMTALKKRERKDKKKATDAASKKEEGTLKKKPKRG
ncbi:Signal recognition particle 14 kDa protein [Linum perenne]